jgi:hypothetical protein
VAAYGVLVIHNPQEMVHDKTPIQYTTTPRPVEMEFTEDRETDTAEAGASEEPEVAAAGAGAGSGAAADESEASGAAITHVDEPEPREVLYCAICSMPPEFWYALEWLYFDKNIMD